MFELLNLLCFEFSFAFWFCLIASPASCHSLVILLQFKHFLVFFVLQPPSLLHCLLFPWQVFIAMSAFKFEWISCHSSRFTYQKSVWFMFLLGCEFVFVFFHVSTQKEHILLIVLLTIYHVLQILHTVGYSHVI